MVEQNQEEVNLHADLWVHVVTYLNESSGNVYANVYNHGSKAKAITERNKLQHKPVAGRTLLYNGVRKVHSVTEHGMIMNTRGQ